MKTVLAAAVLLLALTACGTDSGDGASDPGGSGSGAPMPTAVPAATGKVRSLNIATVMDTGTPELCLGAVAESYPPQCGGPVISNWDWDEQRGMFETQGDVRWGSFAVTGLFDGVSFRVTEAISAALYDPMVPEPTPTPSPARAYSEDELADIQGQVQDLPGAQGSYAADGHVLVDVLYDDGSFQAWADEEYGEHVVLVTSLLVDVG